MLNIYPINQKELQYRSNVSAILHHHINHPKIGGCNSIRGYFKQCFNLFNNFNIRNSYYNTRFYPSTHLYLSGLDCGTNGENWMGLSGNQNLPNQPLEEIKSACDCDDQCTNESDCEYWVYVASSNACWLKKNFDRVIKDSNCISGRKKGM